MFIHLGRCVLLMLLGCGLLTHTLASGPTFKLREFTTGTDASLRGVEVAGKKEAWVSGSGGTVMRTTDAGKSWERIQVPDANELDFRDIEITMPGTVLLMAAGPGNASKLLRSVDAGKSWEVVLQNSKPEGFFDGMAFDLISLSRSKDEALNLPFLLTQSLFKRFSTRSQILSSPILLPPPSA